MKYALISILSILCAFFIIGVVVKLSILVAEIIVLALSIGAIYLVIKLMNKPDKAK